MNSRIVYPAPSFQPPDTCTEHEECQAGQASNADLSRAAQEHYDKISTAAHEWHSAIPRAIDAYYADPERARLEREVIEAAKAEREANKEYLMRLNFITSEVHHAALMRRTEAVDALLAFESSQQQIKK